MGRFLFLVTILVGTSGWAQQASQAHFRKAKVVQIEEGRPFEITLDNDTVIEFRHKLKATVMNVPVTMSENSCNTQVGVKCIMHSALVREEHVGFWKVHPTKVGKPVNTSQSGSPNYLDDSQQFSAVDLKFSTVVKTLARKGTLPPSFTKFEPNQVVWFECEQSLAEMPENILYWDQNFENGNSEITMDNRQYRQVNKVTDRIRNVKLRGDGKVFAAFSPIVRAASSNGNIPGFAYQIQWTIQAPNLIETEKPVCQIKWDVAFGAVFTQFIAFLGNTDLGRVAPNVADYDQFIYSQEYSNRRYLFNKSAWDRGSLQWLD